MHHLLVIVAMCFCSQLFSIYPMLKTHAEYDVLGIGTALTDLIIPVDDVFLQTHAGIKGGAIVMPPQKIDAIIAASDQIPVIKPGGSCANTMKGLGKLGARVVFHFKDGNDEYGRLFEQSLKDYGVDAKNIVDRKLPSGRLACLVTPDANRTFCVSPSASGAFTAKDLDAALFKRSKIVHIEGYALRNHRLVEESMILAGHEHALVSFDLGCPELVYEHKDLIKSLLASRVDILFTHVEELEALMPMMEPQDAIETLSKTVPIVVLLLGDKGCVVCRDGKSTPYPVRKVTAIDTTGAGDLFASGFLYGMIHGWSIEQCARVGNLLGSAVVQYYGAEIPEEIWNDIISSCSSDSNEEAA